MAIDLPDVEQDWIANVAPYVAAMAEMIDSVKAARDEAVAAMAEIQASIDALHGKDISIGVETAGAAAAAAAENLAGAEKLEAEMAGDAARETLMLVGAQTVSRGAADASASAFRDLAAAQAEAAAGAVLLRASEAGTATETHTASDALRGIVAAMNPASAATRIFGLSWNALHWILGVGAETLAVVVPAIIALGAGLDVAMQGAVNAASHMQALWTAAEATGNAFHQTLGTLLGLKPALQQAQDAANPGVYEILGSAVNDAKAHMSSLATAGLDVVHMFDEFSARITIDMQQMAKSGEMQSLLGNMVSDLQELGQVFGNVGHAILNFAADMPGLAEVLLMIVDDISKVILWVSQLPHDLILGAMALEEFYRWGGLAATIIARIGLLLPALAGAPLAIAAGLWSRLAGIMGSITGVAAQLVSGLAKVAGAIVGEDIPVIGQLAGKLAGLSEDMAAAAENTALMGGIGLAVAAFIGLVIVLSRVKDATDAWVASTDKAVQAASDLQIYNVLGKTMQENAIRTQYATQAYNQMVHSTAEGAQQTAYMTARFGEMNGAVERSAQDVQDLSSQQQFLSQTARTVGANVNYLAQQYHISKFAAQALAQEAGVNLQHSLLGSGQAAAIARQQIANLVQGLVAMGAPAGVVGQDMQAIGIQSQLAGTKVSQLNQAWDAWMQSVTGTMADFSQVQTALQGMGQDASAASASLTGSIGSISRSASGMTYTLKGMSADAMQSWQQLTSALNQGNSALDQLRTGMAEGVVTGNDFKTTVQGLVGEFIPFVAGNKTATEMLSNLANEAGGPVTTSLKQLEEWAGVKGPAAAKQFADGMNNASQAMGNMSKVAQNLSAVVSSDLDAALAQNITQTSGVASAVSKYATDLANAHTPASTLHSDVQAISAAMSKENQMTSQASKGLNEAGNAAARAGAQMHTASYYADALANSIRSIPTQWTTDVSIVSSQGLHGLAAAGAAASAPGHASGTPNAAPGFAIVGEHGPELVLLGGGESIFNATETARMLSGIPSAIFGATGSSRGASGGGGMMAAPQPAELVSNIHVHLDGSEIWRGQQRETLQYNVRNGGAQGGAWAPGR